MTSDDYFMSSKASTDLQKDITLFMNTYLQLALILIINHDQNISSCIKNTPEWLLLTIAITHSWLNDIPFVVKTISD